MTIPPGPLSPKTATMISKLLTTLEQQAQTAGVATADVAQRGGITITAPRIPERMIAKITGHQYGNASASYSGGHYPADDCRYSWVEWRVAPNDCTGDTVPLGRQGVVDQMPAVEINGSANVPEGSLVEIWRAPTGDHFRFLQNGGGCSFMGPDCVVAISGEVCCDDSIGFQHQTFYTVWTSGGVIFYDTLADALFARAAMTNPTCVKGTCQNDSV